MLETDMDQQHPLHLQHNSKILHLVRHAQGVHNVAGEINHDALMSPSLFDAQLSPLGLQQVSNLRKKLLASGLTNKLELVITSPLLRAMQTAVGVFGGDDHTQAVKNRPLMEANVGNTGLCAVSSYNCPPFMATELCRERLGVHPCDKRRSVSEYQPLFPAIDFSLIESNQDNLWEADIRESFEHITARGIKFFEWLWTRKEREIAIVSHSVFLHQTLSAMANSNCCHSLVKDEISNKFENCELRSLIFDKRAEFASEQIPYTIRPLN